MTSNQPRKLHDPLYQGLVQMLEAVFVQGQRAGSVYKSFTKKNRKWGGRDRRLVAEILYDCSRWWRKLTVANGFSWSDDQLFDFSSDQKGKFSQQLIAKNLQLYLTLNQISFSGGSRTDLNEAQARWNSSQLSSADQLSVSDFFYDLGKQELAENWEATMSALNKQAPVFLRVNTLKAKSAEQAKARLIDEGFDVSTVLGIDTALILNRRANIFASQTYKSGWVEVQDGASQHVAPLFDYSRISRLVDACAGAGGKTLHCSALMKNKGKILSLDITEWKLEELKIRAKRNGCHNIETRRIESAKTVKRMQGTADALLLDVPCSGSGVLRRHPDPKWSLNAKSFQQTLALQADILKNYAKILKPEGQLVYSTCSVFPSENSKQVRQALESVLPGFVLEKEFVSLPQINNCDGFYAAYLRSTGDH